MRVRAVLVVLAMIAAILVGSAGMASAAPTAAVRAAASAVEYENVGGGNYAKYKAKYPTALNWSKDGCSVPAVVWVSPIGGLSLAYFSSVFHKSCDRHDFGYRNYGKSTKTHALRFDPTRARKNSIDSRFLSNMKLQCSSKFPHKYLQALQRAVCNKAAGLFYDAVHLRGDKAFFG
jgi:hypothetical protein